MKVLWICDLVMPEFCKEFNIKKTVNGGWMSGALYQLKKYSELEVGFCFPIIDPDRMKDGTADGYKYYSFPSQAEELTCREHVVERFVEILKDFKPDVVHIWGTESVHSLEMFYACKKVGLEDNVLVFLQGVISAIAQHYLCGLPYQAITKEIDDYMTLEQSCDILKMQGENEIRLLSEASEIAGRTEWDRAVVFLANKKASYHYMPEILRNSFYDRSGEWNIEHVKRHVIFISQAFYPVKGFHCMLRALRIIVEKYPDVLVRVSGIDVLEKDGNGNLSPYGDYINELIENYCLQANVLFLGKLDMQQMINEYLQANVFASCSVIENSPNSVCEAMMVGTPVVASNVGGTFDFISHGENGYLFDFNAPYMLAYYICQLFENDEKCKQFSRNAGKCILEKLDREKAGENMIRVYRMLADKKSL